MTNLASSLPSTSTRSQFFDGQTHRRRTCEGYIRNSLWPISYLGVICEFFGSCMFCLWKKQTNNQSHGQETQSDEMGAVASSAENTLNAPKMFGPICHPSPKVWDFQKK